MATPNEPLGLRAASVSNNTIVVEFGRPIDNGASINAYDVRIGKRTDASDAEILSFPATSARTVQETLGPYLTAVTTYYIWVRATTVTTTGTWSDRITVRTLPNLPGPTRPFYIDVQGTSGFHYLFNPPADLGGGSIAELQVGWGTDPNNPQNLASYPSGDALVMGLNRYTTYFVKSRARNELGWGPWSEQYQILTHSNLPAPPNPTFLGDETQTTVHFKFQNGDDGGSPIVDAQVGWSTDPNNVQFTYGSNGDIVINNLSPATNWYFWARVLNAEGWSGWSSRSVTHTLAGARIRDNGVWKEAIPYVNVDGTWHLAQPYAKSVGLWKKAV